MKLDKSSPVPLHLQLKAVIDRRILSGEWPPNSRVPSERELSERLEVSRITVRQALAALVTDGRLIRSHGRGTFVAHTPVNKSIVPLLGFSDEIRARGLEPGAQVVDARVVAPPLAASAALRLAASERTYLLKRVRLAGGTPMAVETVYLPERLFPDLLDEDFEDQSLYRVIEGRYGVVPVRAKQQWQAIPCPGADARLLRVRRGSPVFYIHGTAFAQEDTPFEYQESVFRGDKYLFVAELRSPGLTNG